MSGTLYTYPDNFKAQKIQIAANYANNALKVVQNEPDFVVGVTDKSADFLKKFPLGKVPAFENGEICLSQTNAIAYYVGNDQTRGGDSESLVLEWIGFADNEILPNACTWVYPTLGIMAYNKQATETAKEEIKKALSHLNNHLSTRTWLVGERITQADISVACTLSMLYKNVLDATFRNSYANVNRWFMTAINQPQFKSVLGEVKLCEKMAQFDAKKFNEIQGKSGGKKKPAKGESGGGDSKKKTPQKPEAKDAAEAPPKESSKDPWGHLAASKFSMDAWKKFYSNNDKKPVFKYFWENYDKENYSFWHMKYKYNNELEVAFMASNLVRGMYQRIDKMRKNTFGSCSILKTESGALEIEGLWFWKGQELAFELSPDWQIDYVAYDWKKLSTDDANFKQLVEDIWWGEDLHGHEVMDQKVYK